MKCGVCGFKARTIKGIGAHYRKKHPGRMKRRARSEPRERRSRGRARTVVVVPAGAREGYHLEHAIRQVQEAGGHVTF